MHSDSPLRILILNDSTLSIAIAATTGATTAPAVVGSAGTMIDDGQGLGAAAGGAAAGQGQGAMIDGDEEITARRRAWLINLFSRSPASLSFP